ncbi:MAG: hypothetical protein M3Y58_16015, partial [Chloroflexota bacterium]|nr:hypothetical protein [Chloroflexota bacterium]
PAAEEGACSRAMEAETDLDTLFCFKYQRTVGMDNTVRFGGERIAAPIAATGAGHPTRKRRETGDKSSMETGLSTATGQNR